MRIARNRWSAAAGMGSGSMGGYSKWNIIREQFVCPLGDRARKEKAAETPWLRRPSDYRDSTGRSLLSQERKATIRIESHLLRLWLIGSHLWTVRTMLAMMVLASR